MPSGTAFCHGQRHRPITYEFVLQKDPKKRPAAKALLEHRFFKEMAKKPVRSHQRQVPVICAHLPTPGQEFLIKTLLEGIPPLGDRVRILRERENARRSNVAENDIKSQTEYALRHFTAAVVRTVFDRRVSAQIRARREQLELRHRGLEGRRINIYGSSAAAYMHILCLGGGGFAPRGTQRNFCTCSSIRAGWQSAAQGTF